jgi:regulation of enolase protein 1 (concanavalin A-like superfamily)
MRTFNFARSGAQLLLLASLSTSVLAADYYVSGTGSDSAAGTSAATAFRNLSKAAGLVNAGDTVWVLNGTYSPFNLTRPGTLAAPVTWRAYAGHTPEIVNTSNWDTIAVKANYQVIDGLTLTGNNDNVTLAQAEADYADGGGGSPVFNNGGITIDNRNRTFEERVHHLTVRNSTFRKFGCNGVAVLYGDHIVVENNQFYENAWYSRYGCSGLSIFTYNVNFAKTDAKYHNIIKNNKFWNNRGLVMWKEVAKFSDGNGFIMDVSALDYNGRTLVSGNLAVNNGGSGIHGYGARHADIVNNTAYLNGDKVGYADIYASESYDVTLRNNIVYARVGGKVNATWKNTNVIYDYNIYFNGTPSISGPNDIVADPLFEKPGLDPRTADFRLKAGSPGIDSGLIVAGVTPSTDLVGTSRPSGAGIDRGAYEAGAVQAAGGWQATYFNNANLTGTRVVRTDRAIDFAWGGAAPVAGIDADTFSVRWRGQVTPPATGNFTLTTTTDDGVRLWVDGKLVIDKWIDQSSAQHSAVVALTAGKAVPVVMEFYDNTYDATARLEWQSSTVGRQAIPASAVTAATDATLPAPFAGAAIGSGSRGSATESEGVWTLESTGGDIWDAADVFEFASRPLTGDGTATACVNAQSRSDVWAKAGLMWRESNAAGARHASVFITPDRGAVFLRRLGTGAGTSSTASANATIAAPYCVRLVRSGNTFTASVSSDRTTWVQIRSDVIAMGSTVQVGLAASSHSASTATRATFNQFTVQSATAGQ